MTVDWYRVVARTYLAYGDDGRAIRHFTRHFKDVGLLGLQATYYLVWASMAAVMALGWHCLALAALRLCRRHFARHRQGEGE